MIIQISSHRRSGTHALIDFVRKNFKVQGDFYHLENILDWPISKLQDSPVIVKTHEPEPRKKLNLFIKRGYVSEEKAQDLADLTVDIHAYRHPKEVLRSLYYFDIKGHEKVFKIPENMPFLGFLKQEGVQDADPGENRIQFWQRCMRNWTLSEDILAISYPEIVKEDVSLLDKVSRQLQASPLKNSETLQSSSTAIGRGTTQSLSKNEIWSEEAESFFDKEVDKSLLEKLRLGSG